MSTEHFHLPDKAVAKSKLLTSLCMVVIVISLYLTCYFLFFRTMEVDITQDVSIVYDGESNSASVTIQNTKENYNQRIQEFMDSVVYKVKPAKGLKNGDTITITTTFNKKIADRYHIEPINTTKKVVVNNLPERIASIDDINTKFLETLNKKGTTYLNKNISMILSDDFTDFSIHSKPKFVSSEHVYRLFLDSEKNTQKDKIVDIFAITAKGEVNVSSKDEVLETKESTIYYMVTYNEVNTSFTVKDENIYGEKLMVTNIKNVTDMKKFDAFITSKYQNQYDVQYLDVPVTK